MLMVVYKKSLTVAPKAHMSAGVPHGILNIASGLMNIDVLPISPPCLAIGQSSVNTPPKSPSWIVVNR